MLIPIDAIQSRILLIRGQRVMMDYDLAALYGVTTARLNEQVRRNAERFPADFMFQLGKQEFAALMSQIATSNAGRGGRRKLPYAFTEHGAIMAASVLSSPRAVEVSLYVVRAFVRLRELLSSNKELAKKLDELERKLSSHDRTIVQLVNAIRDLMAPPEPKRKRDRIWLVGREKMKRFVATLREQQAKTAKPGPFDFRGGRCYGARVSGG